jgi:serine/threonine-protein kinase RsbW
MHPDDEFEAHVVSACGEAFNNIAVHGYRGMPPAEVVLEVVTGPEVITVRMLDYGRVFDPVKAPLGPLEALPESKMGLVILRAFMDDISYVAGHPPEVPNVLTMSKRRGPK